METNKVSKIGLLAKRLWENNLFQELISNARKDYCIHKKQVSPQDKTIYDIRLKLQTKGFKLSVFWDNLICRLINDEDFPFVKVAEKFGSATMLRKINRFGEENLAIERHLETTDRDFRRASKKALEEILRINGIAKTDRTKEQPWPSFEMAKLANKLHLEGKSDYAIMEILNKQFPNNTSLGYIEVRKLRHNYKKRTGNK